MVTDAAPACRIAGKLEPRNALRRATAGFWAGGPFCLAPARPVWLGFSGQRASKTLIPADFSAVHHVPSQPNYRLSPVVGSDGDPRPPESSLRGWPQAPHPVPLKERLMRAPPREQDGRDIGPGEEYCQEQKQNETVGEAVRSLLLRLSSPA